jgi:hypothetical protein
MPVLGSLLTEPGLQAGWYFLSLFASLTGARGYPASASAAALRLGAFRHLGFAILFSNLHLSGRISAQSVEPVRL